MTIVAAMAELAKSLTAGERVAWVGGGWLALDGEMRLCQLPELIF
jgi:hypothetical protein